VKNLNPSSSGTGNLALQTFHGKKDRRKCDSKKNLRNTTPVLCAVRKTEENVIQRKNLRNTVPVLCAVRKWLWNAGR
jgi:hypothetical protein